MGYMVEVCGGGLASEKQVFVFVRPPDMQVGELTFYQAFFLSFFVSYSPSSLKGT